MRRAEINKGVKRLAILLGVVGSLSWLVFVAMETNVSLNTIPFRGWVFFVITLLLCFLAPFGVVQAIAWIIRTFFTPLASRILLIVAIVLVALVGSYVGVRSLSKREQPVDMPNPGGSIPPELASSVELVDQIVRGLGWGNIAFNTPTRMTYAQPQSVELLLSPSVSVADLQAQLEQKMSAESAKIHISNRMEAHLTGTAFAIEALTPDLQAVTSQQITRWKWKVTPTAHGIQALDLAVSAVIDVAGRDAPLVVRTFGREIQVDITIPQRVSGFVQKNWQWLWAAIVVPIAGYLWKRNKKAADAL